MNQVARTLACSACGTSAAAGPLTRCPRCKDAIHQDCLRYAGCPACPSPEAGPPADLRFRRLAAAAIDTAFLLMVGLSALGVGLAGLGLYGLKLFLFAAGAAVSANLANIAFFLGEGGASVGKKLMGLRVLDRQGRVLGWRRALLRDLVFKPASELSLGLAWAGTGRGEPSWHDRRIGAQLVAEGHPDDPLALPG